MTTDAALSSERVPGWTLHLGALSALLLFALAMFEAPVRIAVETWLVSPTYTHCFLIPPIALWLGWRHRSALLAAEPRAAPLALLLAPPILIVGALASLASINEVEQVALVAFLQTVIWATLGTRAYRVLIIPCLFLFLAVPVGGYLVAPMQRLTAGFMDFFLSALSIPHTRTGLIIDLGTGRFEVAEACAGLRFLIATITLGVLFAALTFRRPWKIVVFMISCALLPLIANGIRATLMVVLAYVSGNRIAVGFDHVVYGWGFSVLILFVLFMVGGWFRDARAGDPPVLRPHRRPPAPWRLPVAVIGAVLLIAAPSVAMVALTPASAPFDPGAATGFVAPTGWVTGPASSAWMTGEPGSAGFTLTSSEAPERPAIEVAVTPIAPPLRGRALSQALETPWPLPSFQTLSEDAVTTSLGALPVTMRESEIAGPGETRLVWRCVLAAGRCEAGKLAVRLLPIEALTTGRGGAVAITLSTRIDTSRADAADRLRSASSALAALPAAVAP